MSCWKTRQCRCLWITWLVFTFLSLLVMVHQIYRIVAKYHGYETEWHTEVSFYFLCTCKVQNFLAQYYDVVGAFPSITLCPANPYRRSAVEKLTGLMQLV